LLAIVIRFSSKLHHFDDILEAFDTILVYLVGIHCPIVSVHYVFAVIQ